MKLISLDYILFPRFFSLLALKKKKKKLDNEKEKDDDQAQREWFFK